MTVMLGVATLLFLSAVQILLKTSTSFSTEHVLPQSTSLNTSWHFNNTDIFIGALMPSKSDGALPAVDLALQDVNRAGIIPHGRQLRLVYSTTNCDAALATKRFFDMMHSRPPKLILFGCSCANLTGPLSQMSYYWNIAQMSYADTAAELSERTKYRNLFRTPPSDLVFNPARLRLLQYFGWQRVGTLYQEASFNAAVKESTYELAHSKLVHLLETEAGFQPTDIIRQHFSDDPSTAIKELVDRDVRIVLGNFDSSMYAKVFCAAYRHGLFGSKYQWIIAGWPDGVWWNVSNNNVICSSRQVLAAANHTLVADFLSLSSWKLNTVANMSAESYFLRYEAHRLKVHQPRYAFHGYIYDAVWSVAKALQGFFSDDSLYFNTSSTMDFSHMKQFVTSALNETYFIGVTGSVHFREGDREGLVLLKQFFVQTDYSDNSCVNVGEYNCTDQKLYFHRNSPILFQGKGKPPPDKTTIERRLSAVNTIIYILFCAIAWLGICWAIFLMAINIRYRQHCYIKMSSPRMNNVIIVGCIFSYVSIFLLGLDGGIVGEKSTFLPIICTARSWVLAIGFTLSFGAMFSKTWRVHAIFNNLTMNKRIIRDYKLILIVCVLLFLDFAILTTWTFVDPLRLQRNDLTTQLLDGGDKMVIHVLEQCVSRYQTLWMCITYAYKGLLLLVGCFLAWETRHVSIPALNDSKYIGMSVYNVVIMCLSGAAVSFIIQEQQNAAFVIFGLFIIFSTTVTLCLLFVPKLLELRRDPKGEDKRVRATLKKISKNHNPDVQNNQKISQCYDENINLRRTLEEKMKLIDELTTALRQIDVSLEATFFDHITAIGNGNAAKESFPPVAIEESKTWSEDCLILEENTRSQQGINSQVWIRRNTYAQEKSPKKHIIGNNFETNNLNEKTRMEFVDQFTCQRNFRFRWFYRPK